MQVQARFKVARAALAALLALSLAGAAMFSGCSAPARTTDEATGQASWPMTVTDDAGRDVEIPARPERIVSLAPANTEMLYALGLGDSVVGVTTFCDYPAEAATVEQVGDFAGPNVEAVTAVDPDLVLVTAGVQADQVAALEQLGAVVLVVDPMTLPDVYRDIELIGRVAGARQAAVELVASIKADVQAVADAVEGRAPVTVFFEIGQDPLFTVGAGTLIDELVSLAGGVNVVGEEGYVAFSPEQVVSADPQAYLATHSSGSSADTIASRPGFDSLAAVEGGRVAVLDDNLVSRPGPRVAQGLRLIAEALHPEAF